MLSSVGWWSSLFTQDYEWPLDVDVPYNKDL